MSGSGEFVEFVNKPGAAKLRVKGLQNRHCEMLMGTGVF